MKNQREDIKLLFTDLIENNKHLKHCKSVIKENENDSEAHKSLLEEYAILDKKEKDIIEKLRKDVPWIDKIFNPLLDEISQPLIPKHIPSFSTWLSSNLDDEPPRASFHSRGNSDSAQITR